MTFAVQTPHLLSTSRDFTAIAGSYPTGLAYLHHLRVEGTGQFHADISAGVERVRGQLETVYGSAGPFHRWYAGASDALAALAADYDGVDQRVAAELDAKMPETANNRSSYGLSPDGEKPGITAPELGALLKPPSDTFAGYAEWRLVVESVQFIASMAWVVKGVEKLIDALGGPGRALPNVSDNIRDLYSMQWASLEKVANAVNILMSFSDRIQDETAASVLDLRDHWSGNAATACFVNVGKLDDALGRHEGDLSELYGALHSFAIGMQYITDFLVDLLDFIGGNWPDILEEGLVALATGNTRALVARLVLWVEIVIMCIDLLFALVGAFAVAFSSTYEYDVSVPSVAAYVPPDVDGSGR